MTRAKGAKRSENHIGSHVLSDGCCTVYFQLVYGAGQKSSGEVVNNAFLGVVRRHFCWR